MKRDNGYIVFADIKGFSKLEEKSFEVFSEIFQDIAKIFSEDLKSKDIYAFNTWGDAIVLVSKNKNIIKNIVKFRDYFIKDIYKQNRKFKDRKISILKVRISCHYGEFYSFKNKFTKRSDFLGTNINTTARIEPKTRPNEIFVTNEFIEQYKNNNFYRFDNLGEIPLAKDFGKKNLYVLRKKDEPQQVIDILKEQNLIKELPEVITRNFNKNKFNSFSQKDFYNYLKNKKPSKNRSKEFFYVIKECKNRGFYKEALIGVKKLKKLDLDVDNIKVYPFKDDIALIKIEINSLTRLGKYKKAGRLNYSLWKRGNTDSDTLSMLAAQYKRKACFNSKNKLKSTFDKKLLKRSMYLYLEAFRRSFIEKDSYYPAINAAYISKILGGKYSKYSIKLTNYITTEWAITNKTNWWEGCSIAEAYMLQNDYIRCKEIYIKLLKDSTIPIFELQSTIAQIELYKFYEKNNEDKKEIDKIIKIISKHLN